MTLNICISYILKKRGEVIHLFIDFCRYFLYVYNIPYPKFNSLTIHRIYKNSWPHILIQTKINPYHKFNSLTIH